MTSPSLRSTLVCEGRSEAHGSSFSEHSRFLENHKQEGSRGMGGQMADGVQPHSPAAARSLLYTVSPREPVPSTEHEQAWLGFKNRGYLSQAGKHGSRQRSGKACIFHWGGVGI